MSAADAGIVAIVQQIVRNSVLTNVLPDLLRAPVDNGVDLHQAKFCIPFNFAGTGAERGLIPANAGHPRAQLCELPAQRFDFPQIAALVRIVAPQARSVRPLDETPNGTGAT